MFEAFSTKISNKIQLYLILVDYYSLQHQPVVLYYFSSIEWCSAERLHGRNSVVLLLRLWHFQSTTYTMKLYTKYKTKFWNWPFMLLGVLKNPNNCLKTRYHTNVSIFLELFGFRFLFFFPFSSFFYSFIFTVLIISIKLTWENFN